VEWATARGSFLRVKRRNFARRTDCKTDFRQPESRIFAWPRLVTKMFDVAMHNAFAVCHVQSIGNLDGQRDDCFNLHRSPSDAMLERHPVQKLHGDERFAVLLVNFVDRR
jgi:hypothetical protein